MFQPQPTPYSASSFASYPYGLGAAHSLDFLFPTGGAAGIAAGGAAGGIAGGAGVGASAGVGAGAGPGSALGPASCGALYNPYSSPSPHSQLQHHHHQPLPQRRRLNRSGSPIIKMEEQDSGLHDMAAQQAAAERFQPGLEGPFVGEKTPSDAITQEYAKADPVYIEKTIALPQTYSHYRQIKGDGNCGWRAIAFAYYEKLIDLGDQGQIEGEVARLMSLGHMISNIGRYEYHEDFAEEAHNLLRDIAANIANPGLARVILLQRFNDATIEANIIYYFRILSATSLKANAATYDDFAADFGGIANYCSQAIDIVNREIEHLGIIGLANLLLKPIDFVLEIAYLDRSPGNQVNRYRFPEEANQQDTVTLGPTLYLLYRPDHYDILYRAPPVQAPAPPAIPVSVPAPSGPADLQIHRVDGFTNNLTISSTPFTGNMGLLATLPTFGMNSLDSLGQLGVSMGGLGQLNVSGMPPLTSPPAAASPVGEAFVPPQQQSVPWEPQYPEVSQQQPPPPSTLPPSSAAAPVTSPSGYHIRFSPVQLEYEESNRSGIREPVFQTTQSTTFKNSVWNRAHYGNPDFHPEEYVPDEEQWERRGGRAKARSSS
ncbi:peptidase c65 otubain domain-containing protein [Trichoderma breve]|uniref:ubiquitinyl hydrolase 1 n=1 Tax=Trichoderma breve TaxID=2034170 RepID=A0A9W9E4R5_9HYPO|nr:peptidase c65 otubain domain-containing protein [Trichoderma breve]KAJ4858139.1 peptidase c65 otubain domain-containing protein [Trichoderma breve]